MSGLRVQAGPGLRRLLSRGGSGGLRVAGRGGGTLSASGGETLALLSPQVFVRAVVAAVHAPSGDAAAALPSEVTYDIRAVGRADIDLLVGMTPEWRSVRNDEVPIWPRSVGTPCLLVEWPNAATLRSWKLFLPEAIAFFECEGQP